MADDRDRDRERERDRAHRTRSSSSSQRPLTKLTQHHHIILHAIHFLSIVFVALFLVLPASTGPGAGFFWVQVEYTGGAVWNLGGLGACESGTECVVGENLPPHVSSVQAVLGWHFAAGAMFLLLATFITLLVFFPTPRIRGVPWLTFLLPFAAPILVAITLGADFGVKQGLETPGDVEAVETLPSFYLNIGALVVVLAWVPIIQYIRWLGLQEIEVKQREQRRPPPQPVWGEWLNPWSDYNRRRQANT